MDGSLGQSRHYITGQMANLSDSMTNSNQDTTQVVIENTSLQRFNVQILEQRFPNLNTLTVRYNSQLEDIHGKFNFSKLTSVAFLSNSLFKFPSFTYCPELLSYSVQSNIVSIRELNSSSIIECTRLKDVRIRSSGLVHFPNFNELNAPDLKIIDLYDNSISNTDDDDLRGLYNLTELHLEKNDIVKLPSLQDLDKLETFTAYKNSFQNSSLTSFYNMRNLRVLDLGTSMKFAQLPNLKPLAHLEELSLKFKTKKSIIIPSNYLDFMHTLKILKFSDACLLEGLRMEQNRHVLQEVYFTDCQFDGILEFLNQYESLRILQVRSSGLTKIPSVNGSRSTLYELNLNENAISSVPINYFLGFNVLKRVYLTGNNIVTLSNFGQNIHITSLYLSDNNITFIDADTFVGFCCLTYLSLSRNKLTVLAFDIPHSIRYLYLRENLIMHIEPAVLQENTGLTHLRLYSNPMICDYRMCFLNNARWTSIAMFDTYPCHSPENLRNKALAQVLAETCVNIPRTTVKVHSSSTSYTCFPNMRFRNGYTTLQLSTDKAMSPQMDSAETEGCLERPLYKRQDSTLTNSGVYLDQNTIINTQATNLQKKIFERSSIRTDLDCARLCSRMNGCVKFGKAEDVGDGVNGKCTVYIYTP